MRKPNTLVLLLLGVQLIGFNVAAADVPSNMNVQGRLTDSAGIPVAPGFKQFTFRIFDTDVGGTQLWPAGPGGEVQPVNTDSGGLWNARVGAIIPLTEAVFDPDSSCHLEIEVDDGVNPSETLPRIKLNTNPFTFRAASSQEADTADFARAGGGWADDGLSVRLESQSDNVGIGTSSPTTKLEVNGTVTSDGLTVDGAVSGSGFSGWDANASNDLTTSTSFGGDVGGTYSAMVVGNDSHTHGDATVSDNISINNSRIYAPAGAGSVGIGTTSPSQKLSVNGSATVGGLLMASSPPHMTMSMGTSGDLVMRAGNGSGGQPGASLTFISGNSPKAYFANGNVGIGESNPSNILQVQIDSPTDPVADNWTYYSSKRWKTAIRPIDDPMGLVQRLTGVRYVSKGEGKENIGLVAEDVGEVLPEVVAYEENGVDAKSVDYARLVAVLIEGMKEQQKEIEELRSRLDQLTD